MGGFDIATNQLGYYTKRCNKSMIYTYWKHLSKLLCVTKYTYICTYKAYICAYLVPANTPPFPLPSVEAATDNEIMTTPALPIVLKPKGYNANTK